MFPSQWKSEIWWTFDAGGSKHQLRCVYDGAADSLALRLDHGPFGDVLDATAWRAGQSIRVDVARSSVVASVRSQEVPMIPRSVDVPVLRVSVDGRPVVSQEAAEYAVLAAVQSVLLPLLIGVVATIILPRAATTSVLLVMVVVGIGWVVSIPWLARRQWVEIAPAIGVR